MAKRKEPDINLYNNQHVKWASLILRSLNNKVRESILKFLTKKDEATVSEIYRTLKMDQSVASQHLAIMRRAKVLQTRRDGKQIFYSINKPRIAEIVKFNDKLVFSDTYESSLQKK